MIGLDASGTSAPFEIFPPTSGWSTKSTPWPANVTVVPASTLRHDGVYVLLVKVTLAVAIPVRSVALASVQAFRPQSILSQMSSWQSASARHLRSFAQFATQADP